MSKVKHLLVLDPICFKGGSKIATENILRLINTDKIRITIVTSDMDSWGWSELTRVRLYQPKHLVNHVHGIPYFINNFIIAIQLLLVRIRLGYFDIAIGSSGPGIDLSLYMLKIFMNFKLIQLIQGHVSNSRTLGRCLLKADEIYYLSSTSESLLSALYRFTNTQHELKPPRFKLLQNGLSEHNWPSRCQTKRPVIFWAASLLKWKGLDIFLDALKYIEDKARPETHICYIEPKKIMLAMSNAPVIVDGVHWHKNPEHLDKIRASANIFVSTSQNEPFGLSILEAMAAGHCVLLPTDGAYWDCILVDGINCIKYIPNDAVDLSEKLRSISCDMQRIKLIGDAAEWIARNYQAHIRYAPITDSLQEIITPRNVKKTVQLNVENN